MIQWHWLGRANYRRVLADQLALRERVWGGEDGAVLLCEHPPTITLGRSAKRENVLAAGDVPVVPVERGGDVTYHGPGQLMVYSVVRLRAGVVDFLERIARALAGACAAFGADGAEFRRDPAGLYWRDRKMAACGVHIARGVSVHGFALDVATPREAWQRIRPCGLSLAQISLVDAIAEAHVGAGASPTVEMVAAELGPRVVAELAR